MTKETKKIIDHNSIPKTIELFGRTLTTYDDSEKFNLIGKFGEACYGSNDIRLTSKLNNKNITAEEIKLTYLHEMLHFILKFTGFEMMMAENQKIDLEQFVELLSSGIYQYEKTRKY